MCYEMVRMEILITHTYCIIQALFEARADSILPWGSHIRL